MITKPTIFLYECSGSGRGQNEQLARVSGPKDAKNAYNTCKHCIVIGPIDKKKHETPYFC